MCEFEMSEGGWLEFQNVGWQSGLGWSYHPAFQKFVYCVVAAIANEHVCLNDMSSSSNQMYYLDLALLSFWSSIKS